MGKHMLLVMALAIGCGGDEPPSCQQAMAGYYGGGCAFVDLTTNREIPQNEATANCQGLAGAIETDACQGALDEWLFCLDSTSVAEQCDCSREQMALIQCD